jgi:GT2 family glycosyltransferase
MVASVSVIILNYNGLKNLGETLFVKFLSSVLKTNYENYEIIFIDNGSSDKSIEFLTKNISSEKIKIIENKKNYGFSLGNNLALNHANGEYVVLLNNDVEVEPNWLTELVNVMEKNKLIGAAQCKVINFDRSGIQTMGNLLDTALMTHFIGNKKKDNGEYNKISEITYATGSGFIIRRSIVNKIGLFDPDYFFYHDDCDLGWRIRLAGFKIVVVPSSVIYHKGQVTSSVSFKGNRDYYLNSCARIGLLIKNLGFKNIPKFFITTSLSIGFDCIVIVLKGDIGFPKALLTWIIKNFKSNWKKRVYIQTCIRKVDDDVVLESFLDSTLLGLRFARHFSRLLGAELYNNFYFEVNEITDAYYKRHLLVY